MTCFREGSFSVETILTIEIFGLSDERTAVLTYEATAATGDGWEEPYEAAHVLLESVKVEAIELLPLLTPSQIFRIETDLYAQHTERDYASEQTP